MKQMDRRGALKSAVALTVGGAALLGAERASGNVGYPMTTAGQVPELPKDTRGPEELYEAWKAEEIRRIDNFIDTNESHFRYCFEADPRYFKAVINRMAERGITPEYVTLDQRLGLVRGGNVMVSL